MLTTKPRRAAGPEHAFWTLWAAAFVAVASRASLPFLLHGKVWPFGRGRLALVDGRDRNGLQTLRKPINMGISWTVG